jgi:hypothetical protein
MSSFANILKPSIFSVVISNNVLMSNIDTRITHICIYALQHYLYLKCGTCYILTVHKFTWHVYLHPLNLHILYPSPFSNTFPSTSCLPFTCCHLMS